MQLCSKLPDPGPGLLFKQAQIESSLLPSEEGYSTIRYEALNHEKSELLKGIFVHFLRIFQIFSLAFGKYQLEVKFHGAYLPSFQ
eukprot:scaffold22577_cov122-Cylindrotheca_fusiformis.AAC.31